MGLINRVGKMSAGRDVFYLYRGLMTAVPNRLRSHPGPIILNGKMNNYLTIVVFTVHIPRISQLKSLRLCCGKPCHLAKIEETEADCNSV